MKVELISHTPNPVELCGRAAGITYAKEEKEDYAKFIRKIISMGHESVVEHANFTFRVEGVSRALTHQWVRHRLCSFTQRSQRRVDESEPKYILPELDYLPETKPPVRANAKGTMKACIDTCFETYRQLIHFGVKPEDARFVLPNATETKMVWTANARELRHFFKLRLHKTAQWEIREMAQKMFDLVCAVARPLFDDLADLRGVGE